MVKLLIKLSGFSFYNLWADLENSLHFRPCFAERGLFYFIDDFEVLMKNSISSLLLNLPTEEQLFIAERISYLRQDVLHLTQSQFAAALDISQTYLSQIENKKKTVTSMLLYKISSTFNVRIEWLLTETNKTDVFQSEQEIMQYSISVKQEESFHSLCSAFNLQKSNVDFLRWYLSISDEERTGFQQAINFLRKID